MAEIPVEKKSSMSWLWIILAIIVLALLAWWIFSDDDDVVATADNDVVATEAMAPAMLAVGERVDLDNVRVTSLAGDMAFNADVNGQNMLVVFNQVPTPGDATEGEYDINPGSMLNMEGEVRAADAPLPAGVTAQIPAGTDRYIFADSIEMLN
ncbi:hypothetical protein RM533_11130 [Croceicoccus sp. F390]|uniref:Uncharacterized protein n=1 Tax=Croceicoccus esteveae TaxID=3075597 RepID=A0ABU2ZJF5_9SPHN|nr:hypothetical protein [Croceicoccus sp. F390]MDT0576729.1 hypothetical protein [Croceicoccus sp. F390]